MGQEMENKPHLQSGRRNIIAFPVKDALQNLSHLLWNTKVSFETQGYENS